MRKSTLTFVSFLIVAVFIFQFSEVKTNSVQPPSAQTGAPAESTCGNSDCHNNTPNSGVGSVTVAFNSPNGLYVPGNSYTLTVTVTDGAQSRFGFEITSLDGTNTKAGSFAEIVGGSDLSFPVSINGRLYASHHNASAINVWNINWTAPITDVGPVTFYAAGNAANGNDASTGDNVYTTTFQVQPDNTIGINDLSFQADVPFVIHNLLPAHISVQYETSSTGHSLIRLFNLNGQLVKVLFDGNEGKGNHTHSFMPGDVSSGLYLIQLKTGSRVHTEKIIID